MREISLARKYSKALVETIGDDKEFHKIKNELNVVSELLHKNVYLDQKLFFLFLELY